MKRSPKRSSDFSMRRMSIRSEPIPRIMRRSRGSHRFPGCVDPPPHFSDGLIQSRKDRLANEEVSDIELGDLRDRGNGGDGLVIDAVTRMHFKAKARRLPGAGFERLQHRLGVYIAFARGVAI